MAPDVAPRAAAMPSGPEGPERRRASTTEATARVVDFNHS